MLVPERGEDGEERLRVLEPEICRDGEMKKLAEVEVVELLLGFDPYPHPTHNTQRLVLAVAGSVAWQ